MKQPSLLIPLACLAFANVSQADIFIMKDGSRLDAKIISETADSYVLDVQITKSIKDEKTVAKADVKEIEKEKLDQKAFEKLAGIVPAPDLLSADDYEKRMAPISNFIREFPKSPLVKDATTMLDTLKAEAAAVKAGGIKLDGTIISAEAYKANAYELDAKVLEARIRSAVTRGDYVNALRGLNKMASDYHGTLSFAALTSLRTQVLRAYNSQITEQLSTYDARVADRTANMARMSSEDRRVTGEALQEDMDIFEKRFLAQEAAQEEWKDTNPFHKKSLEEAENAIEEAAGKEWSPFEKDAGKAYRVALVKIAESEDEDTIKEILQLAGEYEIPEKYLLNLQELAKTKGVTP